MAQRLLKTICVKCKIESKLTDEELDIFSISKEEASKITFYKGKGCPYCGGTGYKGRSALFEIMPISRTIKEIIIQGKSALDIQEQAIKEGMDTLRIAAIKKLKQGITTPEQVLAVTVD